MKGRRGQRDGTDASGSAAALRAPRRRLAGPGGEGGPRGDAGTTFVSPGGSREVGGPKNEETKILERLSDLFKSQSKEELLELEPKSSDSFQAFQPSAKLLERGSKGKE